MLPFLLKANYLYIPPIYREKFEHSPGLRMHDDGEVLLKGIGEFQTYTIERKDLLCSLNHNLTSSSGVYHLYDVRRPKILLYHLY